MTQKKPKTTKLTTKKKKGAAQSGRRSNDQRLSDQTKIAELYLRGLKQYQIAEAMEMTESTVSRDLDAIRAQWKESPLIDFNEAVQRELAVLDIIQAQAFEAWEKSKEDEVFKMQSGGEGLEARGTISRRSRVGDEKYLKIIRDCVDTRAKLLGLYKQTIEHTGKDGQPIQVNTTIDTMKPLFQMMRARERNGSTAN